ncbi:MAG: LacI family DNA-binding transcriptional regulator [Chthoniobacteraceae bacterium]
MAENKPSSHPITLREFAQSVGLSTAAVSYILNGKAVQMKIAAETVKRVQAAAKSVGYRPNPLARNLRRQKSDAIAVILSDLGPAWPQGIMDGIQPILEPAGYLPILSLHHWNPEREQKEILSSIQRKTAAIITQPLPENAAFYERLRRSAKIPFLLLGDNLPNTPKLNFVAWNSGPAAEMTVAHLIEIGRNRIAFLGAEYDTVMTQARFEGYRRQLELHGLPVDPRYIIWHPSGELVAPAVEKLLKVSPRPDAIFAMNDDIALQALDYLASKKIAVPKEIAVAAMGDLAPSRLSMVSLTTCREPCKEIGQAAGEGILKLMESPETPLQTLIPCSELYTRGTTRRGKKS